MTSIQTKQIHFPGEGAPFPIDPVLSGIVNAYTNRELIADKVLPYVPVGRLSFKYFSYPLKETFQIVDTAVGRKSAPKEIEYTAAEETASCVNHALDDVIPQDDIDDSPENFDPVGRAAEGLINLILLKRELRTAGLVFNALSYDSTCKTQLVGENQFSHANSTPLTVISNALDAPVMRPNKMIAGQQAWTVLRSHTHIVQAVNGTTGNKGMVSREEVAELFELDEVLVGRALYDTAKKGQTASLARAWGKHISLIYQDPNADTSRRITFGFTARKGDRWGGQDFDRNIGARGGIRVRAGESVKELIVANKAGYFIEDAVA